MTTGQRGAAAIPLIGMIAVVLLLSLVVVDAAVYLSGRARAGAAADAAALAAAPVTFRAFGARAGPRGEAARFAEANGARLAWCRCDLDRSYEPRTVRVAVDVAVRTVLFGALTVRVESRAEFRPVASEPGPGP